MEQDKVSFNHSYVVNLFFGSELNTCSKVSDTKFTLRSYLFRAGKLIASADPDKYGSSGHCIAFDAYSQFSFLGEGVGKKQLFCYFSHQDTLVSKDNIS